MAYTNGAGLKIGNYQDGYVDARWQFDEFLLVTIRTWHMVQNVRIIMIIISWTFTTIFLRRFSCTELIHNVTEDCSAFPSLVDKMRNLSYMQKIIFAHFFVTNASGMNQRTIHEHNGRGCNDGSRYMRLHLYPNKLHQCTCGWNIVCSRSTWHRQCANKLRVGMYGCWSTHYFSNKWLRSFLHTDIPSYWTFRMFLFYNILRWDRHNPISVFGKWVEELLFCKQWNHQWRNHQRK